MGIKYFGKHKCAGCGRMITRNGMGAASHRRACQKRRLEAEAAEAARNRLLEHLKSDPRDYCAECGLQRNQHGKDGKSGQACGIPICTGFKLGRRAPLGVDSCECEREPGS